MKIHWKALLNLTIHCFLLTSFTGTLKSQHLLKTHGRVIINSSGDTILLRGMGLGGWMLQEGYMLQTADFANPQHKIRAAIEALIGKEDTDLFYESWLAHHVRRPDIDSLKSWGFNSVRLPLHYNLFTLPIEDEPVPGQQTWLSKGFELTDSLISWCKDNEMYVVLDLHAAPGGQGYDAGISDYDDTKPSLWESKANRDKTVALWKRIADRYADEEWVAGYDLLNEPNWNLPGNIALRNLYKEITDSIRSVDTKHIIFIEGNWFANDFTGLTPPWDENLVYSPHKYWSTNNVASMQWVLDIQQNFNVPLYLGESGENSNVWFRDAIRLLEDLNIGWAWWPMKKIESISCPLSVPKTPAYQLLLDYWNGNAPKPSAAFAKITLMVLADRLKTEHCLFQKDVVDAMFRQVYSEETLPFAGHPHAVPGVIHAADYDLGVAGSAYSDSELATYHISTGNYSAWNRGWSYRNDGVDIEPCSDPTNAIGFNVGFLDAGEWLQYEVDVTSAGVYDLHLRVASDGSGGQFHFSRDGTDVSRSVSVVNTGGWQNWQTLTVPEVILDTGIQKLRFHIDQGGFNVGSFEFTNTGLSTSDISARFLSASTLDNQTIVMHLNKPLMPIQNPAPAGFEVFVNGQVYPITGLQMDSGKPAQVMLSVGSPLEGSDNIRLSYNGGAGVLATDGTQLTAFSLEKVNNTLLVVHQIPGRIQAEDYSNQSGTQLETTTDAGGGQNIAYLDPGDWLDYDVNVTESGMYRMNFRTASESATGGMEFRLYNESGILVFQDAATFPQTGGWQSWVTTGKDVELSEGRYTLRLLVTSAPFNLNWLEFNLLSTAQENLEGALQTVTISPNPFHSALTVDLQFTVPQSLNIQILQPTGQIVDSQWLDAEKRHTIRYQSGDWPTGIYFIRISFPDGNSYSSQLLKITP